MSPTFLIALGVAGWLAALMVVLWSWDPKGGGGDLAGVVFTGSFFGFIACLAAAAIEAVGHVRWVP